MTTYIISGSREFKRLDLVEKAMRQMPAGSRVIFGDAEGVDAAAKEAAEKLGLKCKEYKADWGIGKGGGPARNSQLIKDGDRLVAFWDRKSTGTKDAIDKAKKAGKPIRIIFEDASEDRWLPPPPPPTLWDA